MRSGSALRCWLPPIYSIALCFERSYFRPDSAGPIVVQMRPPFGPLGGEAYRYVPFVHSTANSLMTSAEHPANSVE